MYSTVKKMQLVYSLCNSTTECYYPNIIEPTESISEPIHIHMTYLANYSSINGHNSRIMYIYQTLGAFDGLHIVKSARSRESTRAINGVIKCKQVKD